MQPFITTIADAGSWKKTLQSRRCFFQYKGWLFLFSLGASKNKTMNTTIWCLEGSENPTTNPRHFKKGSWGAAHLSCEIDVRSCFLGGGFKDFYFHPDPWGNDPIWRAYFSNGLKPPTRVLLITLGEGVCIAETKQKHTKRNHVFLFLFKWIGAMITTNPNRCIWVINKVSLSH